MTAIGRNAFFGSRCLTSLTLPWRVTSIGGYAFYGCKALARLTILNRDCEINLSAFTLGDPKLTTICGYPGSTAQTVAEQWGYIFVPVEQCEHSYAPTVTPPTCTEQGFSDPEKQRRKNRGS